MVRLALTILLAPPTFLLAALCAGAAVAAQFGRHSLSWDILTHFAPIWLAGSVAALLAGLMFRGFARWLIASMAVVGVIAAAALMAPEYLRGTGPKAPAAAPGQLKLIQFNIWDRNRDVDSTVDWLAGQQADIYVLEETLPELRRKLAARNGLHVVCGDCDVSILSKAAPLPGGSGRLFPDDGTGPIVRATFRDARGEFTVIGVHDAWPTDASDQQRQEAQLARGIARFPRRRTIASGDFNSTPWSFSRRRWDRAFGLVRRDRAVFSWPAGKLMKRRYREPLSILPLDHIYAGPGWATVSLRRGPQLGSDHYPLVAILAPAPAP